MTGPTSSEFPRSAALKAALVAAAAGAIANVGLFFLGRELGLVDLSVVFPDGRPLGALRVAILTAIPALVAFGVYRWLYGRYSPALRMRRFLQLSAVVLLVSYAAPAVVSGIGVGQLVLMDVMHTVAAVAIIVAVRWLDRAVESARAMD